MVERNIKRRRYLFAALLTLLIFVLGLMLGLVIEGKRVEVSQQRVNEQRLDFNSLQLQYAYINQLAQEGNCDALSRNFDKNVKILEQSRERLESYYDGASVNKAEFDVIRRDYTISQFNYWLFAKKYKDLCAADVTTIIFFYDDSEECPRCNDQGFVLSYLKDVFDDSLLNFAVYGKYESEPMVGILKSTYEVTSYPTLILEDEKIEGFVGRDTLKGYICNVLNNSVKQCS